MNTNPNYQQKLFSIHEPLRKMIDLYDNDKLPSKFIISGAKGSGKATMGYHFINYVFSKDEEHPYDKNIYEIDTNNRSFKLVQNYSHPNLHIVDLLNDKKNIEISQIRQMISYTNKSNFNSLPKIILIDNIENLNINSTNALLKVVEEPNDNTFFILIHDNKKKILDTLKSRCINFKINISFENSIEICNKLISSDCTKLINSDLISYYNTPGDLLKLINFADKNKINLNDYDLKGFLSLLIDNNYYKKDDYIKDNIFLFIEMYFLMLLSKSSYKNKISFFYTKFINKVNNANKFNLDFESIFIEFKINLLHE